MDITMTALMTGVINLAMLCMVVWLLKQIFIVVRYAVRAMITAVRRTSAVPVS